MINSGEYYFDDDTTDKKDDNDVHDEFGRLITDKRSSSSSKQQLHKGKRQLKAFMLYLREHSSSGNKTSVEQVFGDNRSSPRPSKYDKYNAPMMEHHFPPHHPPESTSNNGGAYYSSDLVIWPEVWTHLIDSLQPLSEPALNTTKYYQSAIWW
eukprot:scaffold20115_cov78-Skeletonema_dohrnii-CCMP3373.AAC.1